jgi:hypothetical protein
MASDSRTDQIKKLLIKFKRPLVVAEGSQDFDDFFKLLELNSQLQNPKSLSVQCWSLVSESQKRDHKEQLGYTVISSD